MAPGFQRNQYHVRASRSLNSSLYNTTLAVHYIANNICMDHGEWQSSLMSSNFCIARPSLLRQRAEGCDLMTFCRSWIQNHEEAQVMLASVLVVVGLWWLVRALLGLIINLVCPLLFVVMAVVCVPQLREPLLGQNYPALAGILRNILIKMAEKI